MNREERLSARVARLATVAEAARALLAALPKCGACDARATLERVRGGEFEGVFCGEHGTGQADHIPLRYAAPAEALERALDAAVAAALAGEP